MARSRRRDEDAADERLDDVLDEDALDDDEPASRKSGSGRLRKRAAEEDLDEDLDDDDDEDDYEGDEDDEGEDDEDDAPAARRARANGKAGTATKSRKSAAGKKSTGRKSGKGREPAHPGIFARLVGFVREVVAELRKVIWPTRKELLTYTAVVVVFVTIMFTIVAGLDYGFAKVMIWVFGHGTAK